MVVIEEGGETVTLDELVKRMTEIETLTATMGWALEKFIRTELERQQKQQQQQRQRDFRLSSVELVCTILNFLVIHLGK